MKINIEETNETKEEKDPTINQSDITNLNISYSNNKLTPKNFSERDLIWKENIIHCSDDSIYKRCFKCHLIYFKNGIHKCKFDKFDDSIQCSVENNITLSLNLKKENFKLKKHQISKSILRYNMRMIFKNLN